MTSERSPLQDRLLLTPRGQQWLNQFSVEDQLKATRLVRSLTLVSHSLFEREITRLTERVSELLDGPIALFAARELKMGAPADAFQDAFEADDLNGSVDAVAGGNDLGSEARVAARIRSMAKAMPDRFMSHPNVEVMRNRKCQAVVIVDDLIGSGNRIMEFLGVIWRSRSLRSWVSRKDIRVFVLAFAATDKGLQIVQNHHSGPTVLFGRSCPTIDTLPWSSQLKKDVTDLCKAYAAKTSRAYMYWGYQGTAATLIFEHGCANNVPAILWAPFTEKRPWVALFPSGTVLSAEGSVFPPEIVRRDPIAVLVDAGQGKLALATEAVKPALSEDTLLMLALAEKGIRRTAALSFATGFGEEECRRLQQQCISWGFLTITYRITRTGMAELKAARKVGRIAIPIVPAGEENYYPIVLRKAT